MILSIRIAVEIDICCPCLSPFDCKDYIDDYIKFGI